MTLSELLAKSIYLDLETGKNDIILKFGAVFGDREFRKAGSFNLENALNELDNFASGASFVLGHNLLGHDLPILAQTAPGISLINKPVIDTLYLSPLAFPENPYHRLVKDYKLVRDTLNDPVLDARLAASIFTDQWECFALLMERNPRLVAFYRYCFADCHCDDLQGVGLSEVFAALGAAKLTENEAFQIFQKETEGRACQNAVAMTAMNYLLDPVKRPLLAYCLAWLRVAGGNSILPPWVRHRFHDITSVMQSLRDVPCANPACEYCRKTHDAVGQLQRFFGYPAFRSQPHASDGTSLQEAIVRWGMTDRPQLAILPTGGGKSLCYQIPALVRHFRRGVLTIVVSPLQALMKDQLDGLVAKTGATSAAAVYGMLTPPERGEILERVRLGDIAILYVSPEQLRNRSLREAIRQREIGCWIFDEAHCLSKWGHDFRPDYLYAARFIREFAHEQKMGIPPVACFTATAKQDVKQEIIDHFKQVLGLDLELFEGGVERNNLTFNVLTVQQPKKYERINDILGNSLTETSRGSAVVYAATRRETESIRDYLKQTGWRTEVFHAGLAAPEKRRILEEFIAGSIQVICATNAFGMGIDKDDVRVVIHADIPGSLENYLQEAGRAGRDGNSASCYLLYTDDDIETQFRLGAMSELTHHDISQILRGLRRSRRDSNGEVVITAGELLRDEQVETSFNNADSMADTKVKAAVAWLEKAGFVERNENRTRVFQGHPLVGTIQEAEEKIAHLNLSESRRNLWLAILTALFNARDDEGMSADELAELPEFALCFHEKSEQGPRNDTELILRVLHDMAEAGLIKQGVMLTAFVRHKVADHSLLRFGRVAALEEAMLKNLQLEEPDPEGWLDLSLRRLNQRLTNEGFACLPETLRKLLDCASRDGQESSAKRGSLDMRHWGLDCFKVKLNRDWCELLSLAELRREVAKTVLDAIMARIPENSPASAELLVSFSQDDLTDAIRMNMLVAGQVRDLLGAVNHALMYLHEQNVITLQQGLAIFRQAMTIRIIPEKTGKGYTRADFSPLEYHYKERIFQVHVMNEYARLGLDKIKAALELVLSYFTLDRKSFVQRYFAGRKDVVERATSQSSYQQVVDSLANPAQVSVVAAGVSDNMLVLAGPGSGKTRVVAHRCAYLLRVKRVPPRSILILTFNRNAAITLRRRLRDLVGNDSLGVTVQTYHSLAMRLTGSSFADRMERNASPDTRDFNQLIADAIALLNGEKEPVGLERDELRERLLAGYRYILVDEYQDIDKGQYDLISAIAGRTLVDQDAKLSLLAVGDDDQNIYSFRKANVEFIRRFQLDYAATSHYLVENYRSSAHIIAASNSLIAHNRNRMKTDHPIRINKGREQLSVGGDWAVLDPLAQGRVQVIRVADAGCEVAAILDEAARLRQCQPKLSWSDFAVLARTREDLLLVRAVCEERGIPVVVGLDAAKNLPLARVREISAFIDHLKSRTEMVTASELLAHVRTQSEPWSIWNELLERILAEWHEQSGDARLPATVIVEFIYESLAEQKRDQAFGNGLFLSTVHSAKGMEFPHVFVTGGGWQAHDGSADAEEERRVFYVAMTRARETLCLMERATTASVHTRSLGGEYLLHREVKVEGPSTETLTRRYELWDLDDLFLDYAGRRDADDPVHKQLAMLATGDSVFPEKMQGTIGLRDKHGIMVAALSKKTRDAWGSRLACIEKATVFAIVRRSAENSSEEFRGLCKVGRWEVPIVEVVYQVPKKNTGGN